MDYSDHWITLEHLADHSQAVQGIHLHFDPGESVVIFSPNHRVHQFLYNILVGQEKPKSGQLNIHQQLYDWGRVSFKKHLHAVGLDEHSIGHDSLRAFEQFGMEKDRHFRLWQPFKNWQKQCKEALDFIDLKISPKVNLASLTLSQRKLMVLAGVVWGQPKILVLRDILHSLEDEAQQQAQKLIQLAQSNGAAILWLQSQFQTIPQHIQRVMMLKDGKFVLEQSIEQLDRMELMRLFFAPESKLSQHLDTPKIFYHLLRYNEKILLDLPLSLFLLDTKGQIQLINHHALKLFGLTPSPQVLGAPLHFIFKEIQPDFADWLKNYKFSKDNSSPGQFVFTLPPQNCHLSCNIFPIDDQFGHIGYILLMEDRSKLEEYRNNAATNEILASTGLLAAGVAHEINNPLEIAKNYLSVLQKCIKAPEQTEALEAIEEELNQIRHIVGQLVSISSHHHQSPQPFCCILLIKTIAKLIEPRCREKSIQLLYSPSAEKLEMVGHASEVRQIFLNLIKNALESLPHNGVIQLQSEVFDKDDQAWVRFVVTDDGPGIPKGSELAIFHPFYSSKKNGQNMGLGLSIIQGIIHQHKGTIRAENLSQGCRFTVEIPRILSSP
jgi:nitrogen-specific signal transduction histidine kinase/ABC-type branched-subunit amino acid transport system ATPase component